MEFLKGIEKLIMKSFTASAFLSWHLIQSHSQALIELKLFNFA